MVVSDGRRFTESVADNRGTPDNPLPDDDLAAKFLDTASPRLGTVRAQELLDLCWHTGADEDFAELVRRTAP